MGNLSDLHFDANDYEPVSFDLLEPGDYEVCITDSAQKATNAYGIVYRVCKGGIAQDEGYGSGLSLTLEVIDGPAKGRKVFDWINLGVVAKGDSNELHGRAKRAAEIGAGTLSSVCRAVDVLNPDDTSDLHNIPFIAKIDIEPAKEGYQAKNKVKAYKAKTVKVKAEPAKKSTQQKQKPVDAETGPSDDIPF